MGKREEPQFRSAVMARADPDLPRSALEAAIKYHQEQGLTEGFYVPQCIQLAGRMVDYAAQVRRERAKKEKARPEKHSESRPDEPFFLSLSPALILDSAMLARIIQPDVEGIRRVIFSDPAPPFPKTGKDPAGQEKARKRAANWIEAQMRRQPPPPKDLGVQFIGLQREIEKKFREMARLLGAEAPPIVIPTRKTLFYFKPSDTNRVAAIDVAPPQGPLPESPKAWGKRVHRAPLWYLERRTRELAEETGFASAAVVDYVLTGARPLLPPAGVSEVRIYGKSADRYRVSSDGAPLPLRREAHITLHARDITHSQVRELYQALRGRLAVVQKKRSGIVKDTELFQLVGELGGLPERPTSRKFWGRVLKEWNRRTPKKWHVRNWRALMMRWMRLKKCWPVASRISGAPD